MHGLPGALSTRFQIKLSQSLQVVEVLMAGPSDSLGSRKDGKSAFNIAFRLPEPQKYVKE